MKVLVIGTDRMIFEEDSPSRRRILEQGGLFEELHIVVFSKKSNGKRKERLADNVWVYPTNSVSKFHYVFDAAALGKKICRERFFTKGEDVISSQDPFECGLVSLSVSKATSLPFQVQVHTDFLSPHFRRHSFLNSFRVFLAKKIIPKAASVRAVSDRIADSIRKKRIATRRPIDVLPVFMDSGRLVPGKNVFDFRRLYPQFDFILLCVGRMSPEKNFSLAVKVLARILKIRPHTGLFLVGDGSEKKRLASFAKKLGLQEKVVFVPHQDEDIYSYYKSADVFVMPSVYEGYGLVLLEAAFVGCPIVSADVGAVREIVPEEFWEFICPVGKEKCFFEKVKILAENYEKRERYAAALAVSAAKVGIFEKRDYLGRYVSIIEETSRSL